MSVDGHTNPLLSKTHLSSSLVGRAPHRAIVQRRLCDRTFGLCLHASGDRELIPLRPSGSGSAVPEHQSKVSSSVTSAPGPPKLSLQVTLRIQSGSQQQAPVPHVSRGDCPPPSSALSPWSLDSTETEEQRGRWPRVLNSGSFLMTLNPLTKHEMFLFFLRFYLFIFTARGREGEREKQCVVASHTPSTGGLAATQACALTGNQTHNP